MHLYRVVEQFDHGSVQPACFLWRERIGQPVIPETRCEQYLVRVYIPYTCDKLLVHQQCLELGLTRGQHGGEARPAYLVREWIETQMRQLRWDPPGVFGWFGNEHLSECAGIDKPQLPSLAKSDDDMCMLGNRFLGAFCAKQLPAHSQMNHQDIFRVKIEEQVLPQPSYLSDLFTL